VIDNIVTYYPSTAYQIKTDGTHTNTRKYYSFSGSVVAMVAPKGVLRKKWGSHLAATGSGKFDYHYSQRRRQFSFRGEV